MKKLLSIFVTLMMFAVATTTVFAGGESNCQIVYGGGEVCEEQVRFTINKMVQTPANKGGNGEYVENLTINDARYGVNQNVNFKIVVENTGNTTITNLNVVDSLPELLTFVSAPGSFDTNNNEVKFVIGELKPGEKKEIVITVKTNDLGKETVKCVVNNVAATASNAARAEDNAQVCIEKPVVEKPTVKIEEKPVIEKIPSTGPEIAVLAGLIPAGAAGLYLRRKFN